VVASEPAQAGFGVGGCGGNRLGHFVRQRGSQLSHGGHPVDVCEIRPRLTERFFNALLLGQGGDQREGQNAKRDAGHHQRQIGLIETCVSLGLVDGAVSGKDGRSHRRVVHTGNRHTHDDRGHDVLPRFRGSECQPQGRRRRADRDDHGERNE